MANCAAELNVNKIPDNTLRITVRTTRMFYFRLWLGVFFLKLAARTLNAYVDIAEMETIE